MIRVFDDLAEEGQSPPGLRGQRTQGRLAELLTHTTALPVIVPQAPFCARLKGHVDPKWRPDNHRTSVQPVLGHVLRSVSDPWECR